MNKINRSVDLNSEPDKLFFGNSINDLINMPVDESGRHNIFMANIWTAYLKIGEQFRKGEINRKQHAQEKAKIMAAMEMKRLKEQHGDNKLDEVNFPELT